METEEPVRLDKWVWAARFWKTRGLAALAIDGGKVQLNGERAKRAKPVHLGDRLRIRQGPYEFLVIVRGLAERRGPPAVAAALYEELPESRQTRERLALQLRAMHSAFHSGEGRPTKKDRRRLTRLKRGDRPGGGS
jgi:ribosome-associated heat shock protein Hsp15